MNRTSTNGSRKSNQGRAQAFRPEPESSRQGVGLPFGQLAELGARPIEAHSRRVAKAPSIHHSASGGKRKASLASSWARVLRRWLGGYENRRRPRTAPTLLTNYLIAYNAARALGCAQGN